MRILPPEWNRPSQTAIRLEKPDLRALPEYPPTYVWLPAMLGARGSEGLNRPPLDMR